MTEDELLTGLAQALELAGWTWTHIRRSDGVTMGSSGLPDLIAGHVDRDVVLAWELKSATGGMSADQVRWMLALRGAPGVDVRTIRPVDYDRALGVIVYGHDPCQAWPVDRPPSADETTYTE